MDTTITRLPNPIPTVATAMGNQRKAPMFEPKPAPTPLPQQVDLARQQEMADRQRLQMVERAAANFRETYAVSDSRFTIFKDTAGQYITRVTSLVDGSVSYYPEPEMLQTVRARQSDFASSVDVKA